MSRTNVTINQVLRVFLSLLTSCIHFFSKLFGNFLQETVTPPIVNEISPMQGGLLDQRGEHTSSKTLVYYYKKEVKGKRYLQLSYSSVS